MKKCIIAALFFAVTLSLGGFAADSDSDSGYKKYRRSSAETVLLTMHVSEDQWTFQYERDDVAMTFTFSSDEITTRDEAVSCGQDVVITEDGIHFPALSIDFDDVMRIDVTPDEEASETVITFFTAEASSSTSFRRRERNIFAVAIRTAVDEEDFIRGSVVAFAGDVDVYGEVNQHVLALQGDIFIGDGAVVRGDVLSAQGRVRLDKDASVYGLVSSKKSKRISRRHYSRRWKHYDNQINVTGVFNYNRVDGLALLGGIEYTDSDSVLPSFKAMGGYAFESERWRYTLSLTQTIARGRYPVAVGGEVFRLLKSGDDALISDDENSVFTFLFNEDWKDYYEAEGGYGFVRFRPLGWNTLEIGYLAEEQRWLGAHPKLWSLFGAKEFRGNFSSVPYDTLQARRDDFDDKTVTSLLLTYTLDTRDDTNHPRKGWYGKATYEFSPERWKGDFDFERFEARLRRFQPLNHYQAFYLTGAYGNVEGEAIPLNRYFFLGGLGTLHGMRHKEYRGTEYVLTSAEYHFGIPGSDISPFIQYDGGKIAAGGLGSGVGWKSSLGIGIDFDRSIRVFMSKRLDNDDDNPVFYARFCASF